MNRAKVLFSFGVVAAALVLEAMQVDVKSTTVDMHVHGGKCASCWEIRGGSTMKMFC